MATTSHSRKIAIVGLSESSHSDAPWDDSEWEIWGLPWDSMWKQIDINFEMHPLELLKETRAYRPDGYFDRLRSLDHLYLQRKYKEVPNADVYPLERVQKKVGDYFNSSIAYMMAKAICDLMSFDDKKIGLWGVDMAPTKENPNAIYPRMSINGSSSITVYHKGSNDTAVQTEFEYQRPNMEYLIGLAKGLGIEVYIPEQSSLCKFQGEGIPLGTMYPTYPKRYGFLM